MNFWHSFLICLFIHSFLYFSFLFFLYAKISRLLRLNLIIKSFCRNVWSNWKIPFKKNLIKISKCENSSIRSYDFSLIQTSQIKKNNRLKYKRKKKVKNIIFVFFFDVFEKIWREKKNKQRKGLNLAYLINCAVCSAF